MFTLTLTAATLAAASVIGAASPVPPETRDVAEQQYRDWLTSQSIPFGPESVACGLAAAGDTGPYFGLCYANNEEPGVMANGAGSTDGVTWTFTALDEAASTGTGPPGTASTGTTTFGPGTLLVGTDIEPGTYRAVVPDGDLVLCSWSRLSGLSGEGDDIITIDIASDAGAQVVVEIQPSDVAFDSTGCGDWTRI